MNTAAKLSAYGAALALLLAGAWATGSAVGPLTTVATADAAGHGEPGAGSAGHGDTHSGTVVEADPPGVVRTAEFHGAHRARVDERRTGARRRRSLIAEGGSR